MEMFIGGICVFIFLLCSVEKHRVFGLRDYYPDEYKTNKKKNDMPNQIFDKALDDFNQNEGYDFRSHTSTREGQKDPDRVKDTFLDSKTGRTFSRIRDFKKDQTVSAWAEDELHEELHGVRPKKGFWGDKLDPKGDEYFDSREDRIKARSNMSRWQRMMDEENKKNR